MLGGIAEHAHGHMQSPLGTIRFAQRDIGLRLWPVLTHRGHSAWQGGTIDLAQGRHVVIGYPLPQPVLAGQERRPGIKHFGDGLAIKLRLATMHLQHDAHIAGTGAERHEHPSAKRHAGLPRRGHLVGEKSLQRQSHHYVDIFHATANVHKKIENAIAKTSCFAHQLNLFCSAK